MIENKCDWIKYRKNTQLKRARIIRNSSINTIRSTRIRFQKEVRETLEDYSLYKVESTLDEIE